MDHELVVVDAVVGEGIPIQGELHGGGLAGLQADALVGLELRSGAVDAAGQIIDVDLDDIGGLMLTDIGDSDEDLEAIAIPLDSEVAVGELGVGQTEAEGIEGGNMVAVEVAIAHIQALGVAVDRVVAIGVRAGEGVQSRKGLRQAARGAVDAGQQVGDGGGTTLAGIADIEDGADLILDLGQVDRTAAIDDQDDGMCGLDGRIDENQLLSGEASLIRSQLEPTPRIIASASSARS